MRDQKGAIGENGERDRGGETRENGEKYTYVPLE
jgi:hypothetical protein